MIYRATLPNFVFKKESHKKSHCNDRKWRTELTLHAMRILAIVELRERGRWHSNISAKLFKPLAFIHKNCVSVKISAHGG